MKKLKLLILALSLLIGSLYGQEPKQFDKILKGQFVEGPGYAVLIQKNGKTIYEKAIGMANLENSVPLTPNHIFRIGSITKQFTAVAILQLMEQGKLKLDDEITKFIPDYPTHGQKITIQHLLNHTSGIKSYTSMESWDSEVRKKDFTPETLIDLFKDEPMDFNPGEEFRYNNSGYILLGYIIEVITGDSYENYIEQKLFEPLQMKNSSYGRPSEIIENRAAGYAAGKDGEFVNADYLSMTQPYAAGSLLSTTADLSKWYHAIFADQVISKESRTLAHSPSFLNNGEEIKYGFGWSINNLKGSKAINHGGGINGFSTDSAFLPAEKVFITVLSNCTCTEPSFMMQKMAALAIGKPVESPKEIKVAQAILETYAGDYELQPEFIITVSSRDGKLFAKATGQSEIQLVAVEENRFVAEQIHAEVLFNNVEGKIESLTLFQEGEHIAKKIK